MFRRSLLAVIMFIATPALAQVMTAEQRAACMGDDLKFCKGISPGGGRIIACLSEHNDKLSDACKRVVGALQKK